MMDFFKADMGHVGVLRNVVRNVYVTLAQQCYVDRYAKSPERNPYILYIFFSYVTFVTLPEGVWGIIFSSSPIFCNVGRFNVT